MRCTLRVSIVSVLWAVMPGAISVAVPGRSGLLERSNDAYCTKSELEVANVTAANETVFLENRNYDGFCTYRGQTCQFYWRDGSFACYSYCYCLVTSPCTADNNYCFFHIGNRKCYCS